MKIKSHSSFFLVFFIAFSRTHVCLAECDNLKDFCPATPPEKQAIFINGLPCEDPDNTSAHDFKSMELSKAGSRDDFGSSIKIVTASKFLGLNTLGLAIGRSDIEVDGLVNLHNHPRATEMIYVSEGVLVAAFLDTQNQLFQKTLRDGDVFVIPKGLFHFFLNRGAQVATVFSVFNSQNPGLGSLSSIPSDSTLESVEKLKRMLASLSDSELDGVNDDLTSAVLDIIYS
ncbi:Germin protein subfamily 3 member 4 [Spatholobus suberectus]|nr:Germin protein subfamily 3 member 4 [Spatholobus suberectus]